MKRVAKFDTREFASYNVGMPAKNSRNVALTDEQDALVERLVRSGRYASASEVIRDGLRRLEREEEERLLHKWLAVGLTPDEEAMIRPERLGRVKQIIQARIREGLEEARQGKLIDGGEYMSRWKARLAASDDESRPK